MINDLVLSLDDDDNVSIRKMPDKCFLQSPNQWITLMTDVNKFTWGNWFAVVGTYMYIYRSTVQLEAAHSTSDLGLTFRCGT